MNTETIEVKKEARKAEIKVIGIGRSGTEAVNRLKEAYGLSAELITLNTDEECFKISKASRNLLIGSEVTRGGGADGYKLVGFCAAKDSEEDIKSAIEGADMVILVTGLGGGTGTGASPVVARLAKDMGILTVCFVTTPFADDAVRSELAEEGLAALEKNADTVIVIPFDEISSVCGVSISSDVVCAVADDMISREIEGLSGLITCSNGMINIDFADMTAVLSNAGRGYVGVGFGSGKDKGEKAVEAIISCASFKNKLFEAASVIINFTASRDISLDDVDSAASIIQKEAHTDTQIIWGVEFDEEMRDTMKVTVLAVGKRSKKKEEKSFKSLIGSIL